MKRTPRFVIILSPGVFDLVKPKALRPDLRAKFARIASVCAGLDNAHLLLAGAAGVKFGNDARTFS
jgi:hypothetical protein